MVDLDGDSRKRKIQEEKYKLKDFKRLDKNKV